MLKRIAAALLISIIFFACCGDCSAKYKIVKINGVSFRLEIADTQEKRESGLSGRILKDNEGMLFVFESPCRPYFWMKGCPRPLDIVWVDESLKIIGVEKNAPVCTDGDCIVYRPTSKIKYVIELKGGTADDTGLAVGQKLEI